MIVIVNTTENKEISAQIQTDLEEKKVEYKIFEADTMNISPCLGCNYCWLKTPGNCMINDDYEQIVKLLAKGGQMWVISDTALGFINHKGKNIYDRLMPIVTMNLEFRDKLMRHIMRYDTRPDVGVIFQGKADKEFLDTWNKKVASNMNSEPLGVYEVNEIKEAMACMQ